MRMLGCHGFAVVVGLPAKRQVRCWLGMPGLMHFCACKVLEAAHLCDGCSVACRVLLQLHKLAIRNCFNRHL